MQQAKPTQMFAYYSRIAGNDDNDDKSVAKGKFLSITAFTTLLVTN